MAFNTTSWKLINNLKRGLSSAVIYQINVQGKNYAVKIADFDDAHNGFARECHAIRIASQQDIAPHVYYVDSNAGILIMDYINALPLNKAQQQAPNKVKRFARFIKKSHQCGNFPTDRTALSNISIIYDLLPKNFQDCVLLKKSMGIIDEIKKDLFDVNDLRSLHADLNPYNLLFDGSRFYFIDWAAAMQESLYFDLACCVMFFYFDNPDAEKNFVTSYFGRPLSEQETHKFELMKTFVAIYYGLMFLYASSQQCSDLLSTEVITYLPNYTEFMTAIAQGKVNLAQAEQQQKLAFIYIKMALLV